MNIDYNAYDRIKNKHIKEMNGYASGSYRNIAIKVIDDVMKTAQENNYDEELLDEHLEQALNLLYNLRSAISRKNFSKGQDTKIESVYKDVNWQYDLEPWVQTFSDIDIYELNDIITQYLAIEWLSSPTLEWYMINSYLAYIIHKCRNDYIHLVFYSAKSIASFFTKKIYYEIAYFTLKILEVYIFWIKVPSTCVKNFINGDLINLFWNLSMLVFYGMYYYKKIKERRKLMNLITLKNYVKQPLWSPEVVMEKAKQVSQDYLVTALIPLIAKIKSRSCHIFNFSKYN